jgi:LysR family glycine cleavage system transcriptional activator
MGPRDLRLPPLNALRVFHVVMRLRSFRAAAEELLVSPQAVSQQIKLLEETLATPLFDRKARTVEPTEQAIVLSHFVQAGFEEFAEGVKRVTKSTYRNRISLNASPYFATHYLIGRLERFRQQTPGADLRLMTMVEFPDFASDEIDVAIQWGFGAWKDYECSLLVRDPKVICCAPALADRVGKPQDLLKATLLHPVLARSLWTSVLAHLGVDVAEPANELQFHDAATMRRAAISGLGVGLISVEDAKEDIEAGRLVAPLGADALETMAPADVPGFYLIAPKSRRRVAAVATFCDWLRAQDWGNEAPQPEAAVAKTALTAKRR